MDKEVRSLLNELRTEKVKEAVRDSAKALKEGNEKAQHEAILFFYDIKAKSVLISVLRYDDWALKEYVIDNCFDIFEIEDVPTLYEIAISCVPVVRTTGGEKHAVRKNIIKKLSRGTSTIIGVEHSPLSSFSREGIRTWCINILQTAKRKDDYISDLDAVLKYFEQ